MLFIYMNRRERNNNKSVSTPDPKDFEPDPSAYFYLSAPGPRLPELLTRGDSSCICGTMMGKPGSYKSPYDIKKLEYCDRPLLGNPRTKLCNKNLDGYTSGNHIALSLNTSDMPVEDIQKEINLQLKMNEMKLAPKMVNVVVLHSNKQEWIDYPFNLLDKRIDYTSSTEIVLIMGRCKNESGITADGIVRLTRRLAELKILALDYKLENTCNNPEEGDGILPVILVDFGIDFFPSEEIIIKVNSEVKTNTEDEVEKVVSNLMFLSMMLIFTMQTWWIYTSEQNQDKKTTYKNLLKGLRVNPSIKLLLDNLDRILDYLELYENELMRFTPLYMLLHYTLWHPRPTDAVEYLAQNYGTEEKKNLRISLYPKFKDAFKLHIQSILGEILAMNGGSKRKTRRRIKKRGKKGKTRRR